MKQSKLRGPTQVVLNLTNRCNMRCLYCFNSSGEGDVNNELSDKEMVGLVSEIVAVRPYNVCFSGGEPLLRKDLLFKCVRILSSNGIRTNMVSNGTLLDLESVETLRRLGLQEIEVSLDGSTPEAHERFRSKGSFRRVIDALGNLNKAEFPAYGVSMVVTPFNWFEIRPVVELLKRLKTPALMIRPMLLFGRAQRHGEILQPTPIGYRKIASEINKLERGIKLLYADPLSHIYGFAAGLPFFGMEIKANGDLIISPYIQLPLGNLVRHRIEEYWNAGWPSVWQSPLMKELVEKIKSCSFDDIDLSIRRIGRLDLVDNA